METVDNKEVFVPLLTVFPEYGNAPFLWIVRSPEQGGVGGNICDGFYWDESLPLSEGLWRKFVDWVDGYEQAALHSDELEAAAWDWTAFHLRGMQLSRWLKEEVGEAYRVVYYKPCEDPNHHIDERTEILVDGGLRSMQRLRRSVT